MPQLLDFTDWSGMPDKINQWIVNRTPRIQAMLNVTPAVQNLWLHHHLASQQAFHDVNPFPASVLETDESRILPWMPDWIGNESTRTGILVVGSSYAPVIRPEPIIRPGFRPQSPTAADFRELCANGDAGHRQLYEGHFWHEEDAYYGKIGDLFDEFFGDQMGKERIVLTDIVRASLIEVTRRSVNSREFSKNERRQLFCKYLDASMADVGGQGAIFNRIAAMLKSKQRIAVVTLGWFAEYSFAALMKERNGWTRFSPFEGEAMEQLSLNRIRGNDPLDYAAGRTLNEWLNLEAIEDECWKWCCHSSKKEVWMMPIYHPSRSYFTAHREQIVVSLQNFLMGAGCLPV